MPILLDFPTLMHPLVDGFHPGCYTLVTSVGKFILEGDIYSSASKGSDDMLVSERENFQNVFL